MANGVSGGAFSIKETWNCGKIRVSGKDNSVVVFFTFILLNAFMYSVFHLSFMNFFVNSNALSPGLIVIGFFLTSIFFCLVLVILIPIVF